MIFFSFFSLSRLFQFGIFQLFVKMFSGNIRLFFIFSNSFSDFFFYCSPFPIYFHVLPVILPFAFYIPSFSFFHIISSSSFIDLSSNSFGFLIIAYLFRFFVQYFSVFCSSPTPVCADLAAGVPPVCRS